VRGFPFALECTTLWITKGKIMGTTVVVPELPKCNFCEEQGRAREAHYDGKTVLGPWAYMCNEHYISYGLGLGTGIGQRLILEEKEDS
jgi:hypothetical protein